jgi:beta-aspartyl-peptidase (threonine type)
MKSMRIVMASFSCWICLVSAGLLAADTADAIRAELETQVQAWNAGNIDRFMESYWKSDNLTFSSVGKTIRGWQATLDRYKNRYPDKSAMGEVSFDQLEITPLGDTAALVLGRWRLKRAELIGGNFSLVLRKIDGAWRIIHDHTSREDTP